MCTLTLRGNGVPVLSKPYRIVPEIQGGLFQPSFFLLDFSPVSSFARPFPFPSFNAFCRAINWTFPLISLTCVVLPRLLFLPRPPSVVRAQPPIAPPDQPSSTTHHLITITRGPDYSNRVPSNLFLSSVLVYWIPASLEANRFL